VAAAEIDPAVHYLVAGWREGRRPSALFDGDWYRRHNPDVERAEINPLVHYLVAGQFEGRRAHKSVVVYTAIIGNYDELRAPAVVDPDLDYVAFVDDWIQQVPGPWIPRRYYHGHGTDRLTARFIKTHPHLLVPDYEVSVWVDAAFQIQRLTAQGAAQSLEGKAIAFFTHPDRDCAYDEAQTVIDHELDTVESVERMVEVLKAGAHPAHAGLVATGVMIRRHHQPALVRAMDRWWNLIAAHSGRDQLSINFVLRDQSIESATLAGSVWRNDLVQWVAHAPTPWKGLQCGGAYLDADEYEAIERMVADFGIGSAVETGAGETAVLFKMLGVGALSIESTPGPWLRRALSRGCHVVEVPFDAERRQFSAGELRSALANITQVDLLFIDSPIGTENRRHVLRQILEIVTVRYVLYHDVRRDLSNIFADQQRHGLRLIRFVDSSRGLALFAVGV
jgi:hypothetical protein